MHIQTQTQTQTHHTTPLHTHTHTEGEAKHSHIRLILYYSFIKTSLLRHFCPPEMHFIIPKSWVSGHIAEIPALSRRRQIMNSYLKTKQNIKTATITKKNKKERCLQSLLQLLFRKPTFHIFSRQVNPLVTLHKLFVSSHGPKSPSLSLAISNSYALYCFLNENLCNSSKEIKFSFCVPSEIPRGEGGCI